MKRQGFRYLDNTKFSVSCSFKIDHLFYPEWCSGLLQVPKDEKHKIKILYSDNTVQIWSIPPSDKKPQVTRQVRSRAYSCMPMFSCTCLCKCTCCTCLCLFFAPFTNFCSFVQFFILALHPNIFIFLTFVCLFLCYIVRSFSRPCVHCLSIRLPVSPLDCPLILTSMCSLSFHSFARFSVRLSVNSHVHVFIVFTFVCPFLR